MLRDTAVAQIKEHLGFKRNLDSTIVTALQRVQKELENEPELPWFLRKAYSSLVTVEDTRTVALPSDFIRETDDDQMFVSYTDDDGVTTGHSVLRESLGYLRVKYAEDTEGGPPEFYDILDGNFYLYPLPDDAYTLSGSYYASDTVLDSDIENKWLKYLPETMIARAGLYVAQSLGDEAGLKFFAPLAQYAATKLHQTSTANLMAGRKLVMGGED